MLKYKIFIVSLFIGIVLYLQPGAATASADSNVSKKLIFNNENGMISLFWTVAIVGGCIAITLTYVSWRKYKGEQKKKLEKDKTVD
ncbi:hypothetical protein CIL05_11495 [Virgibacillus profundi]|uniref:Sporulation protein YpjB n=1 Tax=Virgibacillus profundi TaxID=2024555 RepID=A0A2A2IEG9_9BACI|nr:hypothetical protein CIL05_11495 [Virgibacillus profundi]PXY53652.1 hypothetical protein CIT14_11605 [Virgibacillus profundi]